MHKWLTHTGDVGEFHQSSHDVGFIEATVIHFFTERIHQIIPSDGFSSGESDRPINRRASVIHAFKRSSLCVRAASTLHCVMSNHPEGQAISDASEETPSQEITLEAAQLAWSSQPDTGSCSVEIVDVDDVAKDHISIVVAAVSLVAAAGLLCSGIALARQEQRPAPLASPPVTYTVTAPPSTVLMAPTTTMAFQPPAVTSPSFTPTMVSPHTMSAPPTMHTAAENQAVLTRLAQLGITPSISVSEGGLIQDANESCELWKQGGRAAEINQDIALEHDLPLMTATLISSTAQLVYTNCFRGAQ
jgi:hypothetical protein